MDFIPFHRRPSAQTAFGLLLLAAGYVWSLNTAGQPLSASSVILDVSLGAVTLLLMIALASQFVLPVRSWDQRSAAFNRLLGHMVGARGPVIFVQEGRAMEAEGERDRQGPGVLVIDRASAAVLRTDVRFTRAVGPGVVFTHAGERLAQALDLRRQVRALGHSASPNGGPTTGQITSWALTQDGIPVSTELRVTFMLDSGHVSPPREGRLPDHAPFEFNPAAAERAVYGQAHADEEGVPWTDLPLRLAVEIWRDQVKQRPLEAFLGDTAGEAAALEEIQVEMLARLTSHASEAVGEDRRRHRVVNREFELLYLRGVRVLAVNLYGLYLPREVREERIRHWRERWSAAVKTDRADDIDARQGDVSSPLRLPLALTAGLRARLDRGDRPSLRETVSLLMHQARQLADEHEVEGLPPAISNGLEQAFKDVDRLSHDCQAETEGWKL